MKTQVSCIVIQDPIGKIWLGKHAKKDSIKYNEWVIPGGKREEETLLECAGRELREETGIICDLDRLRYLKTINAGKYSIDYFYLSITFTEKSKMVICEREYSEWKWFNEFEVLNVMELEKHQINILDYVFNTKWLEMTRHEFNKKYKDYLEPLFYGLSIDHPRVIEYLDKEFENVIKEYPDFKYYQIKLKWDEARVYVSDGYLSDKWEKEIDKILNNE